MKELKIKKKGDAYYIGEQVISEWWYSSFTATWQLSLCDSWFNNYKTEAQAKVAAKSIAETFLKKLTT